MHIPHRFLRPGRVSVFGKFLQANHHLSKTREKKHVATQEVKNNQFYPHTSLVGGIPTPLKNMKVSWDDEIPNLWKQMFQTTNQFLVWTTIISSQLPFGYWT